MFLSQGPHLQRPEYPTQGKDQACNLVLGLHHSLIVRTEHQLQGDLILQGLNQPNQQFPLH